ncbi:hypothetical protein BABA_13922 [Neobacillus bataviensis LMG 21833]|uniref:Uncharacterized protein n=1 Tax=Neobacillus bataviensis LMG 21833 TaxID=1117379 RepID=K6E1G6_9BACI|nr:hypothetical protein BABA_13922 [Neobacillus bataviensis LMG 21833]
MYLNVNLKSMYPFIFLLVALFYLRGISTKIITGKNNVDEYLWSWKEKRDIFAIILFKLLQLINGNI